MKLSMSEHPIFSKISLSLLFYRKITEKKQEEKKNIILSKKFETHFCLQQIGLIGIV